MHRPTGTLTRALALCALCLGAGCYLIPTGSTECSDTQSCPDGQVCSPTTSTCVAADADMGAPVCVGECPACKGHTECPSLVCALGRPMPGGQAGGICVPQAALVYVDNHNGACTSDSIGDGNAPATAVCTLAAALNLVSAGRSSLRLLPSSVSYGTLNLSHVNLTVYGPGGPGGPNPALGARAILGRDGISVGVAVTGGAVTLDGVVITGRDFGVRCFDDGSPASLRLRRTQVTRTALQAIQISNCKLDMDQDLVNDNQGGVLTIGGGGDYFITNSFFVGNQPNALTTLQLNTTGKAGFFFNTVADNRSSSAAIDCGGRPGELTYSIIVNNSRATNSQFRPGCRLRGVVVGATDQARDGIAMDPVFTSLGGVGYALDANHPTNQAYLIDQGNGPCGAYDYFARHRPMGTACDIGAHEAR